MEYKIKLPVIIKTESEALTEILAADKSVNKEYLSRPDFDKVARVTSGTLIRKFGSWQELLEKAGIGNKYQGPTVTNKLRKFDNRYLTNDEIISEMQRISALLNKKIVTRTDIRNNSQVISDSIIVNRFGSLQKGLEIAGLTISYHYHERIEDQKYLENILSVWTFYGRQPTANEMNISPSEISKNAYTNRFGTWRKALETFIDFVNADNKKESEEEKKEISAPVEKITVAKRKPQDNRSISLGLRYKVLSSANFKCSRCGNSPAIDHKCRLHVDHILPYSKGGKTILENLQVLCEACNLGKGNRYEE